MGRSSSNNGKLEVLPGTEFVEPFDMIIKAIGEEKQTGLLKKLFPKLELDARGVVARNPDTGQTNLPKVFAGGDCANGGREVVNAVAEGKKAARGIHAFFGGQKISGPVQASRYGVKGAPIGSGFDRPIRVLELEAEYHHQQNNV
jgi:NADPH-dependent glutamate synthase beta subunit-like oxidoreductase